MLLVLKYCHKLYFNLYDETIKYFIIYTYIFQIHNYISTVNKIFKNLINQLFYEM